MNKLRKTSSERLVVQAAAIVQAGGVIIYPTDTVYGLGCDPFNNAAVDRIISIKARKRGAMPILVDTIDSAEELGIFENITRLLAMKFWPGALTILVPSKRDIHGITDETGLVGLRIPKHALAMKLIDRCRGRLVGTSANISGTKPASQAENISPSLSSKVDLVIDGGPSSGQASTIVHVANGEVSVLRPGTISKAQIMQSLSLIREQ